MTTRTPSMVSEVSAIEVASTTLRRPAGAGDMARSCSRASSAPKSATISTFGSATRSLSSVSVRRISAAPGRNTSAEPVSARKRALHGVRHLAFDARARIAAEIARLDRKGAALAFDHRRVAKQRRHAGAVERRRHHQDFQILAQALLRLARQCQPEIRIKRALVEFVEQHGGDAFERWIVEHQPREHALGDHFDARALGNLGAEAHA